MFSKYQLPLTSENNNRACGQTANPMSKAAKGADESRVLCPAGQQGSYQNYQGGVTSTQEAGG
jgi:hypothetical protein